MNSLVIWCQQLPVSSDWRPPSSLTPWKNMIWDQTLVVFSWITSFDHLARAIRRRFERRAARVVDSTITFNKRQFQTRIEFEHLQFFFTWDCFPATPSSQVATLLLMCSSVCLQNIHFNSHLLWIFLIRANLRKVLISMDSSDSSRILWTPLAYCFRRFSKFSSAAFFQDDIC